MGLELEVVEVLTGLLQVRGGERAGGREQAEGSGCRLSGAGRPPPGWVEVVVHPVLQHPAKVQQGGTALQGLTKCPPPQSKNTFPPSAHAPQTRAWAAPANTQRCRCVLRAAKHKHTHGQTPATRHCPTPFPRALPPHTSFPISILLCPSPAPPAGV